MMTSSNGNISASLALCAGNSPVTGEFPSQRPVTRSFDVFFDLRLNKRLSKQSWGCWFKTSLRSLWHHCDEQPKTKLIFWSREKTSALALLTAWHQNMRRTNVDCFVFPDGLKLNLIFKFTCAYLGTVFVVLVNTRIYNFTPEVGDHDTYIIRDKWKIDDRTKSIYISYGVTDYTGWLTNPRRFM